MKHAFVNGIILDGKKDMQPVTGKAVLTDGNKIVDIVSDLAALQGYEIIDLKGAYLLPGLIDLHVHLALSGKPPKPKKDDKVTDYEKLYKILTGNALIRAAARCLVASYTKTEVMSGVTTIRTVGGVLDFDAQVRDLIREGVIGEVRTVMAEYPQGWLAHEGDFGGKQGAWRYDPAQSGGVNCLGDLGTHVENAVATVTGLKIRRVLAKMDIIVPGRVLDDNDSVLVEFENGASGIYWTTQVAIGSDNSLRLRIYGSKGTILWFRTSGRMA